MTLLDTGFLFAFFAEGDPNRSRVLQLLSEHRGQRLFDHVLTTNHVVAETITLGPHRSKDDLIEMALLRRAGQVAYVDHSHRGDGKIVQIA